ncbi:MAG: hypothetical protein K0S08_914 [Gammaproteobacteria bacterium]|jgi:hypothetical protein|nr:hypothetical protein [Gammaproteobacteria bacterium]
MKKLSLLACCLFPLFCNADNFPVVIDCHPGASLATAQFSTIYLDDPSGKYEFGPDKAPSGYSWGGEILSQSPTETNTVLMCADADQFFVIQEKANPNNYCLVGSNTDQIGGMNNLITRQKDSVMGLKCKVAHKSLVSDGNTMRYVYTVGVIDNTN